jgi:hypothetical protein
VANTILIRNVHPAAAIATLKGEKSHPASYPGCSHAKGDDNKLPTNHLGGRSSLSSPHQSSPLQLHSVKTFNTSNQRHRRLSWSY